MNQQPPKEKLCPVRNVFCKKMIHVENVRKNLSCSQVQPPSRGERGLCDPSAVSVRRCAVPQRGQRGTIPASRLKNNPLRMRRRTARSAARRSVDVVTRFERVLAKFIYLRCAAHVPFYVPLADNFGSVNRA